MSTAAYEMFVLPLYENTLRKTFPNLIPYLEEKLGEIKVDGCSDEFIVVPLLDYKGFSITQRNNGENIGTLMIGDNDELVAVLNPEKIGVISKKGKKEIVLGYNLKEEKRLDEYQEIPFP